MVAAQPFEALEDGGQKLWLQRAVLPGLGRGQPPALNDHLRADIGLRLEQDRVHVGVRIKLRGQSLQGLRTADLAAIGCDGRVVRHVLGLERRDRQTAPAKCSAQTSDQHRLADIGAGSLDHQRAGHGIGPGSAPQNSTPRCAFTPSLKGCLTRVISVTRSAASISSGLALRPVRSTWVISGFCVSRKSTTSSISR